MHRVELSSLPARLLLPKYRAHLVKAQFVYADQVLVSTAASLQRRTKLALEDCLALLDQLARAVLALQPHSHLQPAAAAAAFTTGDAELDRLFDAHPRGGIRLGHITELAGQSSSGKTNLCLQLACTVQLDPDLGGVHGGALFISSEGSIPSRRLAQLARHFSQTGPATAHHFLDNVHVETAPDQDSLIALLAYHVPAAIERINAAATADRNRDGERGRPPLPIRLLILDSIAAPFRSAHATGSTGFAQRAKEFVQIGDELKHLAARYQLAVVVVNQVSDVWDSTARDLPPSFLAREQAAADHLDLEPDAGDHKKDEQPFARDDPRSEPPKPTSRSPGAAHRYTELPPAPHQQYSFPSLLYSRFQSPHTTGSFSSVSHPTLLPLPLGTSAQEQQPVAAALGHTWSHIPTSRILCLVRRRPPPAPCSSSHLDADAERDASQQRTRRCMTVVWSPFAPRACVEYKIDPERGIVAIGETRVRAVPGWESYADNDDDDDEDTVARGGNGGGIIVDDGGDGGVIDGNLNEDDDDEKQYWGNSSSSRSMEDLLLQYEGRP
ncbi:hypothetical protein JCM3774_003673 [Rhodotorula dairenensis]